MKGMIGRKKGMHEGANERRDRGGRKNTRKYGRNIKVKRKRNKE